MQDRLISPTSLQPSVGFDKTVTALVWKVSLSVERHSVTPLTLKGYSKILSSERAYCLRLRYPGDLKTKTIMAQRVLEHPATVSEWQTATRDSSGERKGLTWSLKEIQAVWSSSSKGCSRRPCPLCGGASPITCRS
jgi:hypothetical protein